MGKARAVGRRELAGPERVVTELFKARLAPLQKPIHREGICVLFE